MTDDAETARLVVDIDKRLRDFAKYYAVSRGQSLSDLVTDLLREAAARERAAQGPAAWAAPPDQS
jgi:hypothetical protein